jgi:hypothetical protein
MLLFSQCHTIWYENKSKSETEWNGICYQLKVIKSENYYNTRVVLNTFDKW